MEAPGGGHTGAEQNDIPTAAAGLSPSLPGAPRLRGCLQGTAPSAFTTVLPGKYGY